MTAIGGTPSPGTDARAPAPPHARRGVHRVILIALIVWGLLGVIGAVCAVQAWIPTTPRQVHAQIAHLDDAIASGAGPRMQAVFPEGEIFTVALTALAGGNLALASDDETTRREAVDRLDAAVAVIERPESMAVFGEIPALEHGTFLRGWSLLLKATRAELTGTVAPDLLAEADTIAGALVASPAGVAASYPDGYWPCDAVVAMAAVVRVNDVADRPTTQLTPWLDKVDRLRDPTSGLLPHRIDADGTVREGPRGSSLAIIHTFL
ncbi:hypothetical protein, partial [Microbacterium sp.]|uniref:hypothetical protein n=1 Tax=Microbacterium sp. TaxID=51671 RepID=UPI003A89C096